MTQREAPEGGYGWVVVMATFFTNTLTSILMASFPVMYQEYMSAFDASPVIIGTVLSYHVISMDLSGDKLYYTVG